VDSSAGRRAQCAGHLIVGRALRLFWVLPPASHARQWAPRLLSVRIHFQGFQQCGNSAFRSANPRRLSGGLTRFCHGLVDTADGAFVGRLRVKSAWRSLRCRGHGTSVRSQPGRGDLNARPPAPKAVVAGIENRAFSTASVSNRCGEVVAQHGMLWNLEALGNYNFIYSNGSR
jgi:hypothetical protein